jgi:hypothetical protein
VYGASTSPISLSRPGIPVINFFASLMCGKPQLQKYILLKILKTSSMGDQAFPEGLVSYKNAYS